MSAAYFDPIPEEMLKNAEIVEPLPGQLESYQEMPSRLEMAISLFTRNAKSEGNAVVHARSVRLPTIENVTIEALAKYSGLSVNKVIVQLLEVALDEVFQGFDEKERAEIFKIRGQIYGQMALDQNGYPITGGELSKEGEI